MQKIKKGDEVIAIAGRDKGRKGKVVSILRLKNNRKYKVKVENLHVAKKTMKPNPQLNKAGGIIEKELWIDISNVAIFNPLSKKADKVNIKTQRTVDTEGREVDKKMRCFKSNSELVDIIK